MTKPANKKPTPTTTQAKQPTTIEAPAAAEPAQPEAPQAAEPAATSEPAATPETAAEDDAGNEAEAGKSVIEDAKVLSDADLHATLKALRSEARRRDAENAEKRPQVGSTVRILRGRPKYVGKVGTAVIVRKSRAFVTVPGIKSPAYCLLTDLELVQR